MTSVAFVMPAHGRHRITAVAMRALARTIEKLQAGGLEAGAFVVTDEQELIDVALEHEFGVCRQENAPLGRKFNDGYQAATDPAVIDRPFDHVIPIGSDDWIDAAVLLKLHATGELPGDDEIVCFTRGTFVSENGRSAGVVRITYPGGLGIRVIPRALLAATEYRPVAEQRMRAIDASTLAEIIGALRRAGKTGPMLRYRDFHPAQIIDWKSSTTQLNPFRSTAQYLEEGSPFPLDAVLEAIALIYGADLVDEMISVYRGVAA